MPEPTRKKVMISCVAPNDPESDRGEKPIVYAVRKLEPDRVDLLYTSSSREAFTKTDKKLYLDFHVKERYGRSLGKINPTDYDELIDPMVNALNIIQEELEGENVEYHIVENAAPQMRNVLMLAALSRIIKDAPVWVWHVVDPDKVQSDENRMKRVNLSVFEGASLRAYQDIRLILEVAKDGNIYGTFVPGIGIKRNPKKGRMRLLLELCKARRGDAYGRRDGWVRTNTLKDGYGKATDRTQAMDEFNAEVAELKGLTKPIPELISRRGSTNSHESRISLEPHEILIQYE